MKRTLIAALALFIGAAPAVVFAATTSTKPKTTTTSTTTTSTTTTTTTAPPKTLGGTVVLGGTRTQVVPPMCPVGVSSSNCDIVLTRSTGLETIRDSIAYPTRVRSAGNLVAFTVGVAKLSSSAATTHQEIANLDATYGGVAMAGITVLKPRAGQNKNKNFTVVSEGPMVHLQPYLGYVVQFPLATPIPVVPGEVVALTVPTWAPVLTYNLSTKEFAYRQSRTANCAHAGHYQNAQLTVGQNHDYKCDYAGTRVEYNATELVTPPTPKNYVH